MRAFFAIALPQPLQVEVAKVQSDLRDIGGVAWVPPEKLHLTLKFLGEVDENARLDFTPPAGAFDLVLEGAGTFGDRVAWIGIAGAVGPLRTLAAAAESAAERAGVARETRAWIPHLTVGRLKSPVAARKLKSRLEPWKDKIFGTWSVTSCVLMQSVLSRGGAVYSVRREFPL